MIFNFPSQTEDILVNDCEKIATCGCHQTTFSPLYQSNATTRKMESVLGKMDYDQERRFYYILDEILNGGESPFFERRTLWTFNRLDENLRRRPEPGGGRVRRGLRGVRGSGLRLHHAFG